MMAVTYTALLITICCRLTRVTKRTTRIKTYLDLKSNDEDQEEYDKEPRNKRLDNIPFPDRPNCKRNQLDLEEFKDKIRLNRRADTSTNVREVTRQLAAPKRSNRSNRLTRMINRNKKKNNGKQRKICRSPTSRAKQP